MKILIIGAGGHGQVVADILLQMSENEPELNPLGYIDDDPAIQNLQYLGLKVLGKITDLKHIEHNAVIIGIGENEIRRQTAQQLGQSGERFFTAVHPAAVIAHGVKIGPGSVICAGAVINTGSNIGTHVILNTCCSVDHHNEIESFVHVAPGAHLGGNVLVGEGALVGLGSAVLPQKSIGRWAIIGAGAVVIDNVKASARAVGNPARILEK
ncbi:acetyltransferase [candidate division KSB1 bacterium]|nr:acetyltransferase [candidate division KSB1 bacterium]